MRAFKRTEGDRISNWRPVFGLMTAVKIVFNPLIRLASDHQKRNGKQRNQSHDENCNAKRGEPVSCDEVNHIHFPSVVFVFANANKFNWLNRPLIASPISKCDRALHSASAW